MPIQKIVNLYKFDELSDKAKERARDWWRSVRDSSDYDFTIDDFVTIAEMLGVSFRTHEVRLHGGGRRQEPNVYWSGFSSQGDGACFEGNWYWAKGCVAKVKAHAPQDETLHALAERMASVQKRNFYQLAASIRAGGGYSHSGTMQVEVERHDEKAFKPEDEIEVRDILRALADWLYERLREEDEYQTSDEYVDDTIEANEYTFTEDGKRED